MTITTAHSLLLQLINILPQLVEALRYEPADYSMLAIELLQWALYDRRFALKLYWQEVVRQS